MNKPLNDAEVYMIRGAECIVERSYDQAIADFTQAIKLTRNNYTAYSLRGHANYLKGDWDAAIADYTQLILLNPNDAGA